MIHASDRKLTEALDRYKAQTDVEHDEVTAVAGCTFWAQSVMSRGASITSFAGAPPSGDPARRVSTSRSKMT